MTETWRVGRKLGRTLYVGDAVVGMVDTPELAARIVVAMNQGSTALAEQYNAEVVRRLKAESLAEERHQAMRVLRDQRDEAVLELADELRAQDDGYLGVLRREFKATTSAAHARAEKAEAQVAAARALAADDFEEVDGGEGGTDRFTRLLYPSAVRAALDGAVPPPPTHAFVDGFLGRRCSLTLADDGTRATFCCMPASDPIHQMARGGPVRSGGVVIVGELGREQIRTAHPEPTDG